MIIDNFDLIWTGQRPNKANSVLVIDPDAVLPFAISCKFFKMIARWNAQINKLFYGVEVIQLPGCHAPDIFRAGSSGFTRAVAVVNIFCGLGFEVLDHKYIITRILYDIKRQRHRRLGFLKS